MSAITEGSWERAFQAVKEQFEIDNLLPEQENSLGAFFVGRNIFVNLPTVLSNRGGRSFLKASWFQCYHGDIIVAIAYGRPGSSPQ